MKLNNIKSFTVRVEYILLEKFKYCCDYEGRSGNKQIIQLMLKFINDFEKEHGKINNHQ